MSSKTDINYQRFDVRPSKISGFTLDSYYSMIFVSFKTLVDLERRKTAETESDWQKEKGKTRMKAKAKA